MLIWLWWFGVGACVAVFGLIHMKGSKRYKELVYSAAIELKWASWLPAGLLVLERYQDEADQHPMLATLRQAVMQLYGPARAHGMFRIVLAEMVLYAYGGIGFGLLLPALTDGSAVNFLAGSLVGLILPLARVRDLLNKAERRRQEVQLELPELLSKLTLLVQAGETVQKALTTCVDRKKHETKHSLYAELTKMLQDVSNGYSFPQAFEQFAKRCAMQEVSMFATTILINQRRGGATFVLAMEELGRQLWDRRKAVARKRGEEASTKLVFPMMLMFIVVLAVVGAPALLMMR
ncbi:type II secretion system F family protein [Paenibacillus sp. 481]|uniref:type II secretion system F family protein n=1 Tax=Paenibacillus sp. 481 TaxID=2835869 RepID=UPI001E5C1479|nr:type II secretion system F family protein [Paenibacillus sp. 481]UHA72065.1 type II secretion system F family protein [Paenibacillus sp. 481]